MRVLAESWCFCNGGGKSERLKASIFTAKSTAMARLGCGGGSGSGSGSGGGDVSGTGFLIHRNLLLTTHVNFPSVAAAEGAEIRLHNGVPASLVPHRFFITSSVLDLTIVGLDSMDGDSNTQGNQPHHYLKTSAKPNLELGNTVYLLGHAKNKELAIGEGKVVIATDNLIKLSTEGFTWSPGTAGFDSQGNVAFMICDPMKLATSPTVKSSSNSSSSSSSRKKDEPLQFGIPMPAIRDWLNQHWEGSLDDVSKPRLPLIRLVSLNHKSEHSCASFTMRQVFKEETEGTASTSNGQRDLPGPSGSSAKAGPESHGASHVQGIPTPEIYESRKVTANPVREKGGTQIHFLGINFPPRVARAGPDRDPDKKMIPGSGENFINEPEPEPRPQQEDEPGAESTGSVGEVELSSSMDAGSEARDEPSEVETLYSAETAESRNYSSPREGKSGRPVGRSQSCVSYNRWGPVHRNPVARRASSSMEKQRSMMMMQGRNTYSQGAPSHKAIDYFSPTVSSAMKKRNHLEQPPPVVAHRSRPSTVHSSPRWNF